MFSGFDKMTIVSIVSEQTSYMFPYIVKTVSEDEAHLYIFR